MLFKAICSSVFSAGLSARNSLYQEDRTGHHPMTQHSAELTLDVHSEIPLRLRLQGELLSIPLKTNKHTHRNSSLFTALKNVALLCLSPKSYKRASSCHTTEHLQQPCRWEGRRLGLRPVPAPKSCFPFLAPGVLWTILWVGLMREQRGDRLAQCYTDPQEGFSAPPTPQLPVSLGLGKGLRVCIPTSSKCGCSGGHTLRTTSLEARVQLPFWGNCLWCPLKYQGILRQASVHLKP